MNEVYRALSDPTRRRVLALLRERDMTAGELAANFELSAPTMSGHFAVLKEAGLIQADRTGSTITYRLNVSVLEEAMMALMDAFRLEPRRSPR
jgi:ArsR family transcriptional regulator, repressor of sdpIR and other operons